MAPFIDLNQPTLPPSTSTPPHPNPLSSSLYLLADSIGPPQYGGARGAGPPSSVPSIDRIRQPPLPPGPSSPSYRLPFGRPPPRPTLIICLPLRRSARLAAGRPRLLPQTSSLGGAIAASGPPAELHVSPMRGCRSVGARGDVRSGRRRSSTPSSSRPALVLLPPDLYVVPATPSSPATSRAGAPRFPAPSSSALSPVLHRSCAASPLRPPTPLPSPTSSTIRASPDLYCTASHPPLPPHPPSSALWGDITGPGSGTTASASISAFRSSGPPSPFRLPHLPPTQGGTLAL